MAEKLTKERAIWFAECLSTLFVPLAVKIGAQPPPGIHGDWTEAELAAWVREAAQLLGDRLNGVRSSIQRQAKGGDE